MSCQIGKHARSELLRWTASAERYSEHPLAEAVRRAARQRDLELLEPEEFIALPGIGVRARVDGHWLEIGNWRAHPGKFRQETRRPVRKSSRISKCLPR